MDDEPIVPRVYYSIGEVCDLTGLKPHVLRYWETQFDALKPNKNRAGNRAYRQSEVETVLLLKHLLYEERFTINGARRRLKELRKEGELQDERQEVAGPELIQIMKEELMHLRELLTPPGAEASDPPASSAPVSRSRSNADGDPPDSTTSSAAAPSAKSSSPPSDTDDDPFPQLQLGVDDR